MSPITHEAQAHPALVLALHGQRHTHDGAGGDGQGRRRWQHAELEIAIMEVFAEKGRRRSPA